MSALAVPLVASLATLATADLRLDLLAEGRTSTLAPEGSRPDTRQALLARPGATLRLDAAPFRLEARYAATAWTSDAAADPTPRFNHDGRARLERRRGEAWRAGATATATRGWTDPLGDPVLSPQSAGLTQSAATVPVPFEALGAVLDASVPLDRRTTLDGEASAARSEGVGATGRALLPAQQSATLRLGASHLLSPRSTLRLVGIASATRTGIGAEPEDTGWASAVALWRVGLAPALDGWAGAGGAVRVRGVRAGAPAATQGVPLYEVGLARRFDRGDAQVSSRATPFTDRFTGDLGVMLEASGSLRWEAARRVTLTATAAAGSLLSGDTALASASARGRYAITRTSSLEAGLVGRWQRERRSDVPSYGLVAFVVALAWGSGPPRP